MIFFFSLITNVSRYCYFHSLHSICGHYYLFDCIMLNYIIHSLFFYLFLYPQLSIHAYVPSAEGFPEACVQFKGSLDDKMLIMGALECGKTLIQVSVTTAIGGKNHVCPRCFVLPSSNSCLLNLMGICHFLNLLYTFRESCAHPKFG